MADQQFTAERLRELVDYDPDTGVFTRKVRLSHRYRVGDKMGGKTVRGYMQANIGGTVRPLHRLAWLYVHGEWPKHHIDHINGDRSDNRIANLRDVTNRVNRQNTRKAYKNNQTGLLGVSRVRSGKFVAQIMENGRHHRLGEFPTPELAHDAYLSAKRRLHEDGCTL